MKTSTRVRPAGAARGRLDTSTASRRQTATVTPDVRAEWWSRAACLTAEPDLFFPISLTGPARLQVAAAKAVCAGCPVKAQCLSYALAAGPLHGVWGGTTDEERRRHKPAAAAGGSPRAG